MADLWADQRANQEADRQNNRERQQDDQERRQRQRHHEQGQQEQEQGQQEQSQQEPDEGYPYGYGDGEYNRETDERPGYDEYYSPPGDRD